MIKRTINPTIFIILLLIFIVVLLKSRETFKLFKKYQDYTEEERLELLENDLKRMKDVPMQEPELTFIKSGYLCRDYQDIASK